MWHQEVTVHLKERGKGQKLRGHRTRRGVLSPIEETAWKERRQMDAGVAGEMGE